MQNSPFFLSNSLSSSDLSGSLRPFLGDFTPGRWHSPSSTRTWIKPCSCSWMFFPKPELSPRLPAPAGRALCWGEGAAPTAPGGCGPCLPCQHPQTSQSGAGALQGKAEPCQTTGWGEERCLQEFCSSGTDSIRDCQWQDHTLGIISKPPLWRAQTPVHGPALAWAALEAFLCFK